MNYYYPNQFNARPQVSPELYQTPQYLPAPQLKGRPVSSFEEARAAQIDFDGSTSFFPDIVNKKIYTKQINLDGTLLLNTYSLVEEPAASTPVYVTKDEFEAAITKLQALVTTPTPDKNKQINF